MLWIGWERLKPDRENRWKDKAGVDMEQMGQTGKLTQEEQETQAKQAAEMEPAQRVRLAKGTFSRLGWCYLAGTVLMNILQIVLGALVQNTHPEWMRNADTRLLFSSIIVYGFTLPCIYLLARSMPKTVPERRPVKWWQFLILFLMGYALIFVSNIVGNIFTVIIGLMKGSQVNNELIQYVTGGSVWVMFLFMVVIAPIMEELIFRKVLVDRTLKYGQGMAVVLSGLMFGLFHGNLNQFAYAVVLGAFFAFIYIRTGNIKITIGLHMLVNFMGSVVASSLLKQIHYEELLETLGEPERMIELVQQHLGGWLLYGLYILFVLGVVIAGIVLLIVNRRKFRLEAGEVEVPADQRFQTLFLNPGILIFCMIWVVLIIMQLFA